MFTQVPGINAAGFLCGVRAQENGVSGFRRGENLDGCPLRDGLSGAAPWVARTGAFTLVARTGAFNFVARTGAYNYMQTSSSPFVIQR